MKKVLLAAALVAVGTAPAHAGFVTGAIVGALVAGGSGSKSVPQGQFISSDTHDVIICDKSPYGMTCKNVRMKGGSIRDEISPALYAGVQGYKVLHKVGVLVSGTYEYIVMEVSK